MEYKIDKLGFTGTFEQKKIFKKWGADTNRPGVLSLIESGIEDSRKALQEKGRDPNGGLFSEIKKLIQVVADARRQNVAFFVVMDFKEYFEKSNLKVVMTTVSHPPVSDYEQVNLDETIKQSTGLSDDTEKEIRGFVIDHNSKGQPLSHVKAIRQTQDLRDKLDCI